MKCRVSLGHSQAKVDYLIEVPTKSVGINTRYPGPPLDKDSRIERKPSERAKFGYSATIAGDGQPFAALDPVNDLATVVL